MTLQKEQGNFRLERQCTIHLLEAGFTQATKIIFNKRMVGRVQAIKLIPDEQYAQKGSKSIDAALHKILVYIFRRPM